MCVVMYVTEGDGRINRLMEVDGNMCKYCVKFSIGSM